MKKYNLKGDWRTRKVYLDNVEITPNKSQNINNHSPDGFNWGYLGSGPAQLALAILLETLKEKKAVSLYQKFKEDIISELPSGYNFDIQFTFDRNFNFTFI